MKTLCHKRNLVNVQFYDPERAILQQWWFPIGIDFSPKRNRKFLENKSKEGQTEREKETDEEKRRNEEKEHVLIKRGQQKGKKEKQTK